MFSTKKWVIAAVAASFEIFFYNGWWWRPWERRWYRLRHYDSGWAYYQRVPYFYRRIPHHKLQKNWSYWQKDNHWEKQQTWGVKGLKPRPRPFGWSDGEQVLKGSYHRSGGGHDPGHHVRPPLEGFVAQVRVPLRHHRALVGHEPLKGVEVHLA